MYIVGAIGGERISGKVTPHEEEIKHLQDLERRKFEQLMAERRNAGEKYLSFARMYLSAVGDQSPQVISSELSNSCSTYIDT